MAKTKRLKTTDATVNEPAFPCQSNLHGVQNNGFSQYELIALQAMNGMLANPGVFQLGLNTLAIREMITTASLQYADEMMFLFNSLKQNNR